MWLNVCEEGRQAAKALEVGAGKRRGGNRIQGILVLWMDVALVVWKLKVYLLNLTFLPEKAGKFSFLLCPVQFLRPQNL